MVSVAGGGGEMCEKCKETKAGGRDDEGSILQRCFESKTVMVRELKIRLRSKRGILPRVSSNEGKVEQPGVTTNLDKTRDRRV